jgi:hypothetical protein
MIFEYQLDKLDLFTLQIILNEWEENIFDEIFYWLKDNTSVADYFV